jgi:tRNA-dihydrouridine synthase B
MTLSSPYLLAPLESVSDAAFRRLCWEQGASLTFTEMLRASAVARGNKSTLTLIDTFDSEVPTGIQLMVANEGELLGALKRLETLSFADAPHFRHISVVDLNFGCPSPEIIRLGAGPALLKRPAKLEKIFETARAWQRTTSLPIKAIGAKIRLGLNRAEMDKKVYLRVAEVASASLDYLVVHARHARQDSTSSAEWSAIAEVKATATVPIIGNGDVFGRADAERLVAQTGCDGALIARGAIRSPWIFRELLGAGAGAPTSMSEIDGAEARYQELSRRYGTKQKFLDWHAESFRRMRQRFEGTLESAFPDSPPMG